MCLCLTVDGVLKLSSDRTAACQKKLIHLLHCLIPSTHHKYKCHLAHPLDNEHRWAEALTDVFFPSGASRRRSTSHSRQSAGTLPTGGSQLISSLSGPACTYTFSVVGGFTGNTIPKTMAGWEELWTEPFSHHTPESERACVRTYRGFGFAERWGVVGGALRGKSRSHRGWCLWKEGVTSLWTYSHSWCLWRWCRVDIPPHVPVLCA